MFPVWMYFSTAISVMGIIFIFIHCIAVTFIREYKMQIEGSVMRYLKLDDGLGENRILGSREYLDYTP